ncbi:MAG: hypothetical protein PWR16_2292, partial [Methanoculleus sp.]|nr:hypothetical protein [Methanoculleus sp.]
IKFFYALAAALLLAVLVSISGCVGTDNGPRTVYENTVPPYRINHHGDLPNLVNNPYAHNPTWAELKAYLAEDQTERQHYNPWDYKCGGFAETLHNNAEAAGIRAAWVALDLDGIADDHAVTAFETTDYGFVFIDDSAKDLMERISLDPARAPKLAGGDPYCFVEIGQPPGSMGINGFACDTCPKGGAPPRYEEYARAVSDITAYNDLVHRYRSGLERSLSRQDVLAMEQDLPHVQVYAPHPGKVVSIEAYW